MQEEQKQKYLQLQMFQQQMEELNKHLEMLNEQNAELDISINAMRELEKIPLNNEFLAPIANGVFIKGELKDNQKLVVNVGSNVTVEKTIPQVIELLQQQIMQVSSQLIEAEAVMQELSQQAMKIYKELEADN